MSQQFETNGCSTAVFTQVKPRLETTKQQVSWALIWAITSCATIQLSAQNTVTNTTSIAAVQGSTQGTKLPKVYGEISELRGLNKYTVFAGDDVAIRNSIVAVIRKVMPILTLVDGEQAEGPDVIHITMVPIIQKDTSNDGFRGIVYIKTLANLRTIHSVRPDKTKDSQIQAEVVANDFLRIYGLANGLTQVQTVNKPISDPLSSAQSKSVTPPVPQTRKDVFGSLSQLKDLNTYCIFVGGSEAGIRNAMIKIISKRAPSLTLVPNGSLGRKTICLSLNGIKDQRSNLGTVFLLTPTERIILYTMRPGARQSPEDGGEEFAKEFVKEWEKANEL